MCYFKAASYIRFVEDLQKELCGPLGVLESLDRKCFTLDIEF